MAKKTITVEFKECPSSIDAVQACIAWFDAEHDGLGSFHDRMELCNYSEWACRKSNGEEVGLYSGVPRLVLTFNP